MPMKSFVVLLLPIQVILISNVFADSRVSEKPTASDLATATFADGCFWCMEPPFDAIPGVISTTSGYILGEAKA
jgi:peptide-methionine (S)-S-oxide reductase